MKKLLMLLIAGLVCLPALSQTAVQQPKIMVIPYASEGEDIRTLLESDANKRIILAKIKEAFDNRGCSTVDFIARLKAASTENVMSMDNKSDIKSQIIDMSGADIYVEAEMQCMQNQVAGQANPESRVKIIITAYDIATGTSLSNKIGESGVFYTNDIAKLAMRAIETCADDFLNTMQNKFTDMTENGRSIMLFIGVDEMSTYTMESEVGTQGLLLQDEVELWIESHAYKNNYHLQGVSPNKMIFDDIRLPLIDENTGNNYTANRFSIELFKLFRSLGVPVSRSLKGNTLYFTIK